MQPQILPVALFYKILISLAVAGGGAVFMLPFRFIAKEWRGLKNSIAGMHSELVQQRSNHLEHIQSDGEKQVELLTKTTDLLENIRLELAEQTGFLQAAALPRRASARAKK